LSGGLARTFLRFASPFANLRRMPVIGPALRWASAKIIPRDALTWVQVQHGPGQGIWLRLNPRTGSDYFQGAVEPEVQAVLQRVVRPGMSVYDIGANIGFFSLLAAKLAGANGRVVAFEADPEIAQRLRENVGRNSGAVIRVEAKAVWSSAGEVSFARADVLESPDRGLGHVTEAQHAQDKAATIRIPAVALDEYAAASGAPDFIKCDVEGAETEVFRGAQRLLEEKRPVILCEMHGEENRRAVTEQLTRLGYRCEPCGANHVFAQFPD
jgi:FkbM family methyltransferase